jgi:hypothetical protein
MKIEQAHIDQIKIAFEKMQSKEDLLQLLNEAKPFVYGEKAVPFQLKQLTWYSNPKLAKKRYTKFKIKKKSGDDRTINAPVEGLKAIQRTLSFVLQCVFEPHKAAMGFVRDKSIVDNAKIHAGSRYVYNIDLKDFFPSIDQARVWKCLHLKPFDLVYKEKNEDQKTSQKSSYHLVLLTKHYSNPNKKSEQILQYSYIGYNFREGLRKLPLESGETIVYAVSLNEEKTNGVIDLYLDRSSYESVIKAIQNQSDEKVNPNEIADVFLKLIDLHQKRLATKDNRSTLANIIASLCCTEMEVERKNEAGEWVQVKRNVLPQGAPTSPIITNVICHRMDYLLTAVAKRFGLKYSRYADDLTFSSMHNVYQKDGEFLKELERIIKSQGFHIKESKTRLQKEGYRQEVTGLLVNEKVNVQKRYIKQLREWLYKWETYGYNKASGFFVQNYIREKGNVKVGIPNMTMVLDGKLQYLKMVKGDKDGTYLKLKERFDTLYGKISPINSILDIWENEGIDKAMEVFYLQNPN